MELGHNICPSCGYDLRGCSPVSECPECGFDCRAIRVVLPGLDLQQRLSTVTVVIVIIGIVVGIDIISVSYIAGGLCIGLGVAVYVIAERERRRISYFVCSVEGIAIVRKGKSVPVLLWVEISEVLLHPARNDTAARLYQHLGETARPWLIEARMTRTPSRQLTFGFLAPIESAKELHRRMCDLLHESPSAGNCSVTFNC